MTGYSDSIKLNNEAGANPTGAKTRRYRSATGVIQP